MLSMNPVRLTIGVLILVGLLFLKPLVYFVGIMMVVAGLTGFCLLEKLFCKLGVQKQCTLK